jgi:hypothetical protein
MLGRKDMAVRALAVSIADPWIFLMKAAAMSAHENNTNKYTRLPYILSLRRLPLQT